MQLTNMFGIFCFRKHCLQIWKKKDIGKWLMKNWCRNIIWRLTSRLLLSLRTLNFSICSRTRTMKQTIVILIKITYFCCLFTKVLGRIITLGVLVPHNGSRSMGPEAEAAVKLAVYKVVCLFYMHENLHDVFGLKALCEVFFFHSWN